jgi:hypothetical protein
LTKPNYSKSEATRELHVEETNKIKGLWFFSVIFLAGDPLGMSSFRKEIASINLARKQ